MLNSLLGIARQWSCEKFAILSLKPSSYTRIFSILNMGCWTACTMHKYLDSLYNMVSGCFCRGRQLA